MLLTSNEVLNLHCDFELEYSNTVLSHETLNYDDVLCVACNTVITVKHFLIECADLLEIRKKYFEEKSLYSLFRNMIPEIIFDFLHEIGVFHTIGSVLR